MAQLSYRIKNGFTDDKKNQSNFNQSINQSTNQSINQSVSQSIIQSISLLLINQSNNKTKSINQSPLNQSINKTKNHYFYFFNWLFSTVSLKK